MADSQAAESLIKKEPEVPAQDPIVSRSTSGIILVSVLLLMASLVWSLYDETYGQRPWKGIQREFVSRYTRYLRSLRDGARESEAQIKESPEYQALEEKAKAARESVQPELNEIDAQVRRIQPQLDAITDPFQNQRGRLMVINYNVETATKESAKEKYRNQAKQKRAELVEVEMPAADGSGKITIEKLDYDQLEARYNKLREEKATLLGRKAEMLKEPSELDKKRDDYLKNQLIGLGPGQIRSLISAQEKFDYSILAHQINVPDYNVVDRCEVCHLGTRSPIDLKAEDMAPPGEKPDPLAKAFVSHPNRDLLLIHKPDKFGCSGCHWGNGRATTNDEKAHGKNEHWMYPLFAKDNVEAGCQQCHAKDRITPGAENINLGRDLFYVRGCVGCHRYEGFDRETDALNNSRQGIKQLEDQIVANDKQIRADADAADKAASSDTDESKAEVQRLREHQQSLTLANSLLAARVDQLNLQTKYLMQDQKKIGPNLKDVRLKLRKEWIPGWLKDPQEFRPGTKMPKFWRFGKDKDGEGEMKAVAAYLWQSGFEGKVPEQQKGDANHGKEIFEGRGCLACHSMGEGANRTGGTFAANLTKVGEKANFDYIVRWIYNPRARYAPYCPKEKRDLTPEDYTKNGKPYIFDTELHSKCPNDGAELQVQNMTVMPDFRLSEQDARDVATYIFSLKTPPQYADASFMDDPNLKEKGRLVIKQFGCAGCHEIKGFEEEQRIGKELTVEGATPIERLDFGLATKAAEEGHDPANLHKEPEAKGKPWYNARGFFEHKLNDPSYYDEGKEKAESDKLRMPQPYMPAEWRTALTTFLLGSVGAEGANVPRALFYDPQDQRRQDIQNGWWVIKKYNCMGCHAIQPGQRMVVAKGEAEQYLDGSVLMNLPQYQADLSQLLPPRLTSEGARVDPTWLLRFLHDPSMSDGKTGTVASEASGAKPGGAAADQSNGKLIEQPGLNRNGVRPYLQARMPTFNFSPDELQTLVRFFVALSGQDTPYIKDKLQPLTDQERTVARQIFTNGTPCLKCHITGEATHDAKAIAPNFLLAAERLKPEWTFRWLRDPAQISPGTAMPSGLFKKDSDRWVVSAPNMPKDVNDYHGDHAWLLVRYMFLMTPDENGRLLSASPVAPAPAPAASAPPNAPKTNGQTGWYRPSGNKANRPVAFMRRSARAPG